MGHWEFSRLHGYSSLLWHGAIDLVVSLKTLR